MPTTRRRRTHPQRRPLTATEHAWLHDQPDPGDGGFTWLTLQGDTGGCAETLWREHRDQVLEDWIKKHPGTRPSQWWRFEAPERRRQVSGGRPRPTSRVMFHYPKGVPFPLHRDDDTRFESEASYLRRLGLLRAPEARRLTEADYEPVRGLDVEGERW